MSIVLDGTSGLTTNSGTLISASTIGVGGATPSTSGSGITFPATQSASTDANTLDDYEEGVFTPTLVGFSTAGTTTYSTQTGLYTKIGRQVYIQGLVTAGSISSPVGSKITIGNLPFTIGGATVNDGRFSPTTIFSQAALSYAQTLLPSQGVGTRTEFDCQINASTIAVNDEFCFSAIYTV